MTAPTLSIILEKQNWLRVSQFFLCIRTLINTWFCFFKGSITGTAEPKSYGIPSLLVNARTNQKPKRNILIARGHWPGRLTNFGRAKATPPQLNGAAPNAKMRSLHRATAKRDLAGSLPALMTTEDVLKALARYARESNENDGRTAAMLGIKRKTLRAWLDGTDHPPERFMLARLAGFLRRVGYL
jgi:hypothetical protein